LEAAAAAGAAGTAVARPLRFVVVELVLRRGTTASACRLHTFSSLVRTEHDMSQSRQHDRSVDEHYWTADRQAEAKRRLLERGGQLRDDIERERGKYDADRDAVSNDTVRDPGDASVADLTMDTDLAEIQRDIEELDDINAALARVAAGTYGTCTDCGRPIEPSRLERLPQAARDLECQQLYDKRHASGETPTL
jgi:RNA polymerase-binding transcription factor DksA